MLPRKADYTRSDIEHLSSCVASRRMCAIRNKSRFPRPPGLFVFQRLCRRQKKSHSRCWLISNFQIDAGRRSGAEMLFRTTLEKIAALIAGGLRKDAAGTSTTYRGEGFAQHADIAPAQGPVAGGRVCIDASDVSKLNELVRRLKEDSHWRWSPREASDRLVIFTERIETLKFLQAELPTRLSLTEKQVAILHGQHCSDTEIQQTVEHFGQTQQSPVRLLIAFGCRFRRTQSAHFQSHRLVHFDVPWSLMVFQQRNGRIDRYGQSHAPLIAYLTTETTIPRIKGDVRILEILIAKDEQAALNIGDPSIFMGLYDEELEARRVAEAIEAGQSAEDFEASLNRDDVALDWLDELMTGAPPAQPAGPAQQEVSLFADHYDYLKAGLKCLLQRGQLEHRPQLSDVHRTVQFQPEGELATLIQHQLSPEMRPEDNSYSLTT